MYQPSDPGAIHPRGHHRADEEVEGQVAHEVVDDGEERVERGAVVDEVVTPVGAAADLDAVAVATPVYLHHRLAKAALLAGHEVNSGSSDVAGVLTFDRTTDAGRAE